MKILALALAFATVTIGGSRRWYCYIGESHTTTQCLLYLPSERQGIRHITNVHFYNFGRRAHTFQLVMSPVNGNGCSTNPTTIFGSPPVEVTYTWSSTEVVGPLQGVTIDVPSGQAVCCKMSDVGPNDVYTGFSCNARRLPDGEVMQNPRRGPMSKTIWKIPIKPGVDFSVDLPCEFKIIHVAEQRGDAFFWAEVNPKSTTIYVNFTVVTTGTKIPPDLDYLGTFLLHGGSFVGHLYGPREGKG